MSIEIIIHRVNSINGLKQIKPRFINKRRYYTPDQVRIIKFIKSKAKSNKRVLDKREAEKIIKAENEKNLEEQKKTTKSLSPNEDKTKSKKKENKASVKKKEKKVSKK
mgnify:CR=1 FL=1